MRRAGADGRGRLTPMTPEDHLAHLRIEGDRLASMPPDALDAPVPTIEGWTVERVVRHVGKVHQWTRNILAGGPEADVAAAAQAAPGMPKGPACLPAYRDEVEALVADLAGRDPNEITASFVGPVPTSFWFRRQALEVAIHRTDAADAVAAAGGATRAPIAADLAADGIDEWCRFWLAVRFPMRYEAFPDDLVGRTLHIHGTDDPAPPDGAEWHLTFAPTSVEVVAAHQKGDVALRGLADDILVTLWRRRPLDTIDLVGDTAVAERLYEVAQF